MGRDRRNEGRQEKFTKMILNTMQTEAWRALPPVAQALYPWIKLEWRGPNMNNNGKLRLSVRQAAKCLGCSVNTAAHAFHALQAKGFIVVTEGARLGVGGKGTSPAYEVTELALPGGNVGRKLYLEWKAGDDFAVQKGQVANPTGKNGRQQARHQRYDRTVVRIDTHPRCAS